MGVIPWESLPVMSFRYPRLGANLSELADQVKGAAQKIITKNGESYVAMIDARRLDYGHQLERERIHLLLIVDELRGFFPT